MPFAVRCNPLLYCTDLTYALWDLCSTAAPCNSGCMGRFLGCLNDACCHLHLGNKQPRCTCNCSVMSGEHKETYTDFCGACCRVPEDPNKANGNQNSLLDKGAQQKPGQKEEVDTDS